MMIVDVPADYGSPLMAIVETVPPSRRLGTEAVEFVCQSKVYRLALSYDGKTATIKLLSGFPPARALEVAARVNEALRRNGGRHMTVACSYDTPVVSLYGDAIPGDLRFRVWIAERDEIQIDGEKNWQPTTAK